ncbi:gamma-glutamylcyclotransferase family protein [Natribacillus halophilus]|uniref:Gamma-glutamylcyclotransferase family protein n=1 Tax=Natribacillus halophilus TaxID=549003 RepID=A0A1G8N339_9BACI|nr:gamma-glutamylcyclotransferase family protein [Natribacillus halophilus]SDI74583.1 Uncharacterized conserved protein YtfP, gamma-glutamylcyclotransferase (GGCT)/AIG2-like family [Natribacillus halophilus]
MTEHLVFVYGTLRKNERNAHLMETAELIAERAWTCGRLYDTDFDFPAMVISDDHRVYGELYRVDNAVLHALNLLEGYNGEGENNHYERVRRVIFTDQGEYEAYVYVYEGQQMDEKKAIVDGEWKGVENDV